MKRILVVVAIVVAALPAMGADSVRSLIEGGMLRDLRRPDFRDYRKHVDGFYRARRDELAWSAGGKATAQAVAVARVLAAADAKGVDPLDYDGDRWSARVAALSGDAEALARFDVGLTTSLMRYISDLHIGRISPKRADVFLTIGHKYDLPALVGSLVQAKDIAAELEKVEPPYAGYRRTRDALVRYRALVARPFPPLPEVRKLAPGDSWVAAPQLAARLHLLGDLASPRHRGTRYDAPLAAAVKRFQARHGLEPDGVIGAGTLAALNTPPAQRVRQMQLALIRWRWLPSGFEVPPIVVNIPEFRLRAFDGKQRPELEMRVVVGSAFKGTETPVFADTMETVVFRPYWNVPASIQRKELEPKARRDAGYLRRNGYERVGNRIRQKPGANNALGNVKFLFPNSASIYLHDTQAKTLFSKSRRDFSHGCIRVEDPVALAEWILRGDPKWTRESIERAMKSGPGNQSVRVPRPVPVLLVYATAVVTADGTVHFFDDIYGLDDSLEDALEAGVW